MSDVQALQRSLRTRLLFSVAATAITVGAPSAWAQQNTQVASNSANSGQVETVVVTGTMVHRNDYNTPSPVQVIDASQIKALGYTSTADLLQNLPNNNSGAVTSSFTGALAFGASGISLRGLLEDSTLILVDGHRTSQYPLTSDGERSFTDLNTIPLDAVAQVQVLKDGASSLYGADAIGGVVNIILRHDFQGIEAGAEAGTSQEGGGTMTHETATLGVGDLSTDHFNFYINGEYQYNDAITVGQRGFPFNTNNLSSIGGLNNIGGQPQQNSGSIYGSVAPTMETVAGNILSGGLPTGLYQVLAPGGCGPLGKLTTTPGLGSYCEQNMELYSDDQPQTTREGVYTRMTVEPNAHSQVYLDLSYFHYEDEFTGIPTPPGPAQIQASSQTNTDAIVLPARLTGPGGPGTGPLNPNDPFHNSPNCVEAVSCTDALINYAFGDLPPSSGVSNNNFRGTLEATGDYWGWSYDGALTVAHSWVLLGIHGALNFPQLETDINDGTYNFLYPSKNTPQVLHALSPVMSSNSTSDENSLDFSATRPVFDLPGGPAQFGVGAQYRTEDLNSPSFNANLEGQDYQSSYASGNRRIISVFSELDMPVLTNFEADLSGRFDHYSDFGNTANPKLGLKWAVIPQVTFRGTASTGFKAPGFSENGNSQSSGYVTTTGASYGVANWIDSHGGKNGQNGDAYSENTYSLEVISTSFSGIKPEVSRNFTGGMVVKPFDNITGSLDYYYIQKWDAIQFPNPGEGIIPYLNGQPLPPGFSIIADTVDPLYPHAIPRPAVVSAPYVNNGILITDGLDLSVTGTWELSDALNYTTQFDGTHIFSYISKVAGLPTLQWAGTESPCEYTSCEGTPRDRFTWSHTLDSGPYSVTATVLYISGEKNIESDLVPPNGTLYPFRGGNAFWDLNLHVAYDVNERVQVYGNILNVANSPPPLQPAQYGGVNYNPAAYQAGIVGRFFALGVSYKTD